VVSIISHHRKQHQQNKNKSESRWKGGGMSNTWDP
jgi:hypothetical protein